MSENNLDDTPLINVSRDCWQGTDLDVHIGNKYLKIRYKSLRRSGVNVSGDNCLTEIRLIFSDSVTVEMYELL